MPSPPPRKVLVFGMDGADWSILGPLVESGKCPTLARVMQRGVHGPLQSTIHPHSPTAWASFVTGANPGMHGIFDFVRRKKGSYDIEILTTRERGGRAVWHVLSEKGIPCGVVNVPMTHPPEKVLGYFISGTFTANTFANFSYPKSLIDDLKRDLGTPYRVDAYLADLSQGEAVAGPDAYIRWLEDLNQLETERTSASLHLIQKYKPRFVVHVVTSCDRAQHTFYKFLDTARKDYDPNHRGRDAIPATYVHADAELKRLWDAMGEDTTVIVCSDHGGAPLRRVLYINDWLESEGFLHTVKPSAITPRGAVKAALRRAYGVARQVLPTGIKRQLSGRFDVWGKTSNKFMATVQIDWARTQAFAEGTFGNIRLNVAGRQPLGAVTSGADYNAVRARIRERIEALIDPQTGQPCVERTFTREELYHGERIEEAPDIIVVLKPNYQMVGDVVARRYGGVGALGKKQASLFGDGDLNKLQISGIHSPEGIVLACGPGIAPAGRIEGAHIIDLAPTILALFGVPAPSVMDGRVLPSIAAEHAPAGAR